MWLLLIFIFTTAFIIFLWISQFFSLEKRRIRNRMKGLTALYHQAGHAEEVSEEKKEKPMPKVSFIQKLDDKLRNDLKLANLPIKNREFVLFQLLLLMTGFFLGWLLTQNLMRSFPFSFIFASFPILYVRLRKQKRKERLEGQLVEMIQMVSNSLKAGYSLIQSLEVLSQEMAPPLSDEVTRLIQEMKLGLPVEEALIQFSSRIGSKDLDMIITAMLIQRQVGGNLARILDSIAETIRERTRIQGEIKTLTAQGRMSGFIFMLLPPGIGVILYLVNPEYISILIKNPMGLFMLGIAFASQLVGAVLIRRIVKIEV
ncbi:type II secretion system F family protein [Microaerobacter geothermalis]|uniref:type II secretion system F family protein n=1 Tax=Microaerobacter geothermalis TaxID=674972 RepID=UPI001F335E85|nr:type II secretion system F family protein [Microaerobacter geothermalis]MCF6094185.1 type II secretion system F family protein [Microaerobacter geothermalis]